MKSSAQRLFFKQLRLGLQGQTFFGTFLLYALGIIVLTPIGFLISQKCDPQTVKIVIPLLVSLFVIGEYTYYLLSASRKKLDGFKNDRHSPRFGDSPNVRLQDQVNHLNGILGRLVRFYRLNVYGDLVLSERAATLMGHMAFLLTINFMFYAAAWTLFWNGIFSHNLLGLSGYTILALFGGMIFASAMVVQEITFMTARTSTSWSQRLGSLTIRLIIVFGVSFIISQPIELLVFKKQIEHRIQEEDIRKIAAKLTEDYPLDWRLGTEPNLLKERAERTHKELSRIQEEQVNLRREMKNTQAVLASAKRRFANAKNRQARRHAAKHIQFYEAKLSRIQTYLNQTQEKFPVMLKEAEALDKQQNRATEMANWQELVAEVQKANAKAKFDKEGVDSPEKYDLFRQLRVLYDLKAGNPPRWPYMSQVQIEQISEKVGLDILPYRVDTTLLNGVYWVVIGITMVMPLLVLSVKTLLPQELKDYYNRT
ncbi:MAG TPA: DUF4407 domain-containing protein [Blastocatellia bacterium]|nr:DUF4407 domain-containing protein [Blastocatellia bacterium]